MALTLEQKTKILERAAIEGRTKGDEIEPLTEVDERILDECWREIAEENRIKRLQENREKE